MVVYVKDKEISLAIFIDKYNVFDHYFVLKKFNNVHDLDNFTKNFKDAEALRKHFETDISEYLMDNRKIIKENETKNNKFRGRISAFYYDDHHRMEFVEIKFPKKKVVRDYKELADMSDGFSFLKNVYDIAIKDLNKSSLAIKEKVFCFINILDKYSYHISAEEKKYLFDYFLNPSERNYKALIVILKTNVKRAFMDLERKKEKEQLEELYQTYPSSRKTEIDDEASNFLKYNINHNNDEELFKYHDLDEIDKYTDKFRRK